MKIELNAIEFDTAPEAIQHVNTAGRGKAIRVGGKNLVVEQGEADRLAAAGVAFAYLHDHKRPDGRHVIMTVPVN